MRRSAIREHVDPRWYVGEQFAAVCVQEQVDIDPLRVERMQQAYNGSFGASYLQIVHGYEYSCLFHSCRSAVRRNSFDEAMSFSNRLRKAV